MLKTTDNVTIKISLNAETYNLLANIMFAIHCINNQPITTDKIEVSQLLEQLLGTEFFTKYLESTFDFYEDYIRQKL